MAAAIALAAFLGVSSALAQATPAAEAERAPQAPSPSSNISAACQAPNIDIATPTALPLLTETLEKKQPIKVLAIGSSSTVGVGASDPNRNYPNQLGGILRHYYKGLNLTILNKGVSGEVCAQTADRLRTLVAMERPTLVLWQVGTNDALARVPVEDFKAKVTETVRWLKSHNIDVVLVGLQYTPHVARDEFYHAIRRALDEVSKTEQVLLVRRFAAMEFLSKVKGQPLLAQDELHLNDLGYRCMAEHIANAMVISSFMRTKPRPNFGKAQ